MTLQKSILKDVSAFRQTLESLEKSNFPSMTSFYCSDFPRGCCGDTAELLGCLLTLKYQQECLYVSATGLGDNYSISHAWLEVDGYIIDITADQFNDDGYDVEAIIVTKDSYFHSLFHEVIKRNFIVNDPQLSSIKYVYEKVLNKVNK